MTKTIDVETVLELGRRTDAALLAHGTRLAGRVPDDVRESLAHQIRVLEASRSSVTQRANDTKGATLKEREVATALAATVQQVRETVKVRGLTPGELRAWGVGIKVVPGVNATVIAAARSIMDAARDAGADLPRYGLRERDIRALEVATATLASFDSDQRTKTQSRKVAVAERDHAIAQTLTLTKMIGTAGALEYSPAGSDPDAGEPALPDVVALFRQIADDSVLPSVRKRATANKAKAKADKAD